MKLKILNVATNLLVFLFGFVLFFHPISAFTQDLGRHLLTGEIILTTGKVPQTNLFSYTNPTFPFINHHWFSEVIFYSIAHSFGLFWLLFTMASIGGASFLIIYTQVLNNSKYNLIALFSTILFAEILSTRLDLRPEIFSFFGVALFVTLLYCFREKPTKWIFLLPIFEIFWANAHIYFIMGPFLIGLFLLEAWIREIYTAKKLVLKKLFTKRHLQLLLVLILTCLTTLCNPNTLQGALYPFTVFSNYGYSIEENQPVLTLLNLGFSQPNFLFFFGAVFLFFFVLLVNHKQSKLIDWILASVFTILAFSAVRNFSLFVFALYIPFVTNLQQVIKRFPLSSTRFTLLGILASLVFGGWVLMTNITANGIGFGILSGAGLGVDFLLSHHLPAPLFNNFDIGSYLEYRLYPKEKVFVDGRPEAYPSSFFQKTYIPMQENPAVFEQENKKYHFQTIFFSYTDQTPWARTFISNIANNPDWALVYLDNLIAIWIKNTSANSRYIVHNRITQQNVHIPQPTNTKDLLNYAYFFQLVDWQQAEIKTLQTIAQFDPSNCQALEILTQNPQTHLLYSQNYLAHCQ